MEKRDARLYGWAGCLILAMIIFVPGVAQADSCSCIGGGSSDPEPLEPAPLQAPIEETEDFQANLPKNIANQLVHLEVQDASAQAISEALQNLTGLAIEFRTKDPSETMSLDASSISVQDLLGFLATRGVVAVRGARATWQPPLEDALRETNVTLSVEKVRATDVVAMLSDILGVPMEFEPTVDDATLTVDVKNAPIEEVLSILHQFGNVTGPGLNETQ